MSDLSFIEELKVVQQTGQAYDEYNPYYHFCSCLNCKFYNSIYSFCKIDLKSKSDHSFCTDFISKK